MAAVSSLGSLFNTTAGNKTVTATPAVGDLIVVVTQYADTVQDPVTVSDNQGGTYTEIVHQWDATSDKAVTVHIRTALIASAVSTVFTMAISGDVGGGLQVFKVTGMSRTGASAARQSDGATFAAAGTPTATLPAAALTANALIGGVANQSNPAAVAPRSSPAWTESVDTGFSNPAAGIETMFIDSGETASSIAWGGTSATGGGCAVVELDTSAASAAQVPHAGVIGI